MSKTFDYISGKADGNLAAAEARAEYSEGMLESVLRENEKLRLFEKAHPQLQRTLRDAYDKIESLETENTKMLAAFQKILDHETGNHCISPYRIARDILTEQLKT